MWSDYRWKDYQTVEIESRAIARAIEGQELFAKVTEKEQTHRFIGIYSKNNVSWILTDMAAVLGGFTTVTLYDTLGPTASEHIINECELTTVFTTPDLVHKLLDLKEEEEIDTLENIIVFGEPEDKDKERAEDLDIKIQTLDDL